MNSIRLTAPPDAAFEDFELVAGLKNRGWKVEFENFSRLKWETPGELCARLHICAQTFARRTRDPNCPPFNRIGGPKRIVRLQATKELELFLRVNVQSAPRHSRAARKTLIKK